MRFITIVPKWPNVTVKIENFRTHHLALQSVGLDPMKCDHGICRVDNKGGLSVIVGEFGLFDDTSELWVCCARMYAGPGILYQFDIRGDMIDIDHLRYAHPTNEFGIIAVKRDAAIAMIEHNLLPRPAIRVNNQTIWEWPAPMPAHLKHVDQPTE